jgi:hypothetical protein
MINILIAKNTQIKMINDRGYTLPREELDVLNNYSLKKIKKLSLTQSYIKNEQKLYVLYIEEDDELAKTMNEFKKSLKKYTDGIIISDVKSIKKLQSKKYSGYFDPLKTVQLFTFDDLQYNVTESILNGKFEKIAKSLIVPSIAHIDELSVLFLNDPIVKYYGFEAGDIIKITEDADVDLINNKTISYAVVKNEYVDF